MYLIKMKPLRCVAMSYDINSTEISQILHVNKINLSYKNSVKQCEQTDKNSRVM